MKSSALIKKIVFGFLAAMLIILAAATVIERIKGTAFVSMYIYGSWAFVGLWFVIAGSGLAYLLQQKTYKRPIVFLLYVAFIVILLGAFLTFTTSTQGRLHLRTGKPVSTFVEQKNNTQRTLPFEITLSKFQIEYYPGTQAPSDYVSTIKIKSNNQEETTGRVSMNVVFEKDGFRFYQSGYDPDGQGSILLVKSDKYGLPLTYLGYLLLLIGIVGYFFSRKTGFRTLLHHPILKRTHILAGFLLITGGCLMAENKHTIPKETAEKWGELQMLYRDRICPVETFAKDFTLKLYGKSTYQSLSSEQVLLGWMFYPAEWKDEPIIKIKDKGVRKLLGIEGKYASFSDFFSNGKDYKLAEPLLRIRSGENLKSNKDIIAADEKIQLLFMLQMDVLLKIFPHEYEGELFWYSPADKLAENISEDEQLLIQGCFDLLKEYATAEDWASMALTLDKLKLFQKKSGGELLLSSQKIGAEHLYNKINSIKPLAFANLFIGLLAMVYFFRRETKRSNPRTTSFRIISLLLNLILIAGGLFILFSMGLRGYISGRIPLGNGFETMQFLAVCVLVLAFLFQRRLFLSLPFGFIFSGLVLLVSGLGASNPQITQLQPVLLSPLLSIHVSLIMMAYTLFGFITLNSIAAFLCILFGNTKEVEATNNRVLQLSVISRILLYPGVFLLAAGIFVGAVWAEVSWGTYWSWDPKETWALITMIIYALPLHSESLIRFNRPFFFHVYAAFAFLSVLMTYFGVNYLLGGMHSYGGEGGLISTFIVLGSALVIFVLIPLLAFFKQRNK
ncbi:MAG: cytochrome c biogenesis protein CcsA [Bacteroidales bacterium]|jgi:ABC-type transport system involved in cytochrome c biogenesis permease subunit|nr:cytochrome c biogenesis protein CcsA [Bacteroidales bacterium]